MEIPVMPVVCSAALGHDVLGPLRPVFVLTNVRAHPFAKVRFSFRNLLFSTCREMSCLPLLATCTGRAVATKKL